MKHVTATDKMGVTMFCFIIDIMSIAYGLQKGINCSFLKISCCCSRCLFWCCSSSSKCHTTAGDSLLTDWLTEMTAVDVFR